MCFIETVLAISIVLIHDVSLQNVSWTTVRYMIGEVQYGGRVTDDYDKRLLNTFSKVWFGDNIFQDNFQFYSGLSSSQS